MSLLEVEELRVDFPVREGWLRAVDGVSFSLERGETLGIVGESGSGKSVCVSTLPGLVRSPPAVIGGRAWFDGRDLLRCSPKALRRIRGRRIGMIFQDPMTSLNPYQRVVKQVGESLRIHEGVSGREADRRAVEALEAAGIPDAAERASGWPHEFSGGMRQRAMIAAAMITRPELLIADEPTTALDVTVQRQILELIKRHQRESGTAVIFISHDLAVVAEVCERLAVMWKGVIVEEGATEKVIGDPQHPYTRGLLSCHPALHEAGERLRTLDEFMAGEERG